MLKNNVSKTPALFRCNARSLWVLFALLTLFIAKPAIAASIPEKISFQNILENKDIAMGEVHGIFQDSEGFMWLGGANALFRYDGYEFRQIYISGGDKLDEKESVHFVENIFQDSHRNIWVASRAGLLKYDPGKERLTRIEDDDNNPMKISTSDVLDLAELHTGEILASSAIGLFIVDPVTSSYTSIAADPQKQNWLHSSRVNTIHLEGPEEIWLGTEEGLQKLNWKTKTFTLYRLTPENPALVPDNRVVDIVADGEGKFWLATYNGVVHYDPRTQESQRYVHHRNDRFSIGNNDVMRLLVDSQGILWAASDGGGVSVFDKENNRFINHKFDAGRPGSLSTDKARTVFEDKNGDIWVGNYPIGINFFDRSSAPIATYTHDKTDPTSVSHSMIQHMQEDKDGNLWIGTDGGGLNFFDREKNIFTSYQHDPEDPTTIGANAVLATYIDSTGLVWTGTWAGGLASFDPLTKKFTRYPFDRQRKMTARVSSSSRLNSESIWSIREDKNRDLWISTHSGGLSKYHRETKIFTHYSHLDNDPQSLSTDLVWSSFEDSRGNFWVCTVDGLNLMDRETATFTKFTHDPKDPRSLSHPSVISILEDSKQRLWIGTIIGLNLFNPETKDFTVYNKSNGFIDDSIRNIVEDADGNLWVSTNNGFSSFNPETQKIKNFNRIGGRLVGGFLTDSGLLSKNGEIIFGGIEGMRIFHPEELSENTQAPPVVLTDFKIFADSILVDGPDGILTKAINQTDTITLDHTKSMFVFGFAALNYRDSAKNQYSYKLEGFDKDWQDSGNQRTAKYTNLNAGTYVFRVKGSNNDGVWNEEGKSITIIQLPPPWKTWWAYCIYFLLALALLMLFVYTQHKQVLDERKTSRKLELKVEERTAELRQKNEELGQAYEQLEAISLSDPLTGLSNRRYLQKLMPMDIAKVQREYKGKFSKQPLKKPSLDLTFFILDVDLFKSVNDIYGHTAGDRLLIQLSELLTEICRDSDCVIRWGGEEFLIVSRFTDRDDAPLTAERIRVAIEQHPFTLPDGTRLNKTCSIGFACFPFLPDHPMDLTWEQVIDIADHALYAAKRSGRNRSVGIAANANTSEEMLYQHIRGNLKAMIDNHELTVLTGHTGDLRWD